LTIPENSRDYQIADVYVADNDNEHYVCSVYTHDLPINQQPFEINQAILKTSSLVDNNSKS
jgi:hypothetical protein